MKKPCQARGRYIAGVTSGAGGALAPLAEILRSLEEQKFELKREEKYLRGPPIGPTEYYYAELSQARVVA